jgi:outer membrane protein OmpA-like peptidoglycan-associated protein
MTTLNQETMKTLYKLLIAAISIPILAGSPLQAQSNEQPNRLSIGLFGGATHGHMNIGTEYDPMFGLNLRYAANPTFAIQTNFSLGEMTTNPDDDNYYDREFTNNYKKLSASFQIGMLRMLGIKSENIKVYGNVGLGVIFNDVETAVNNQIGQWEDFVGEDHTEYGSVTILGAGVRFNLGRRLDLFAQYDYNISNSDLIDGYRTRSILRIDEFRRTPDNWSSLKAGLQIKLGGSDTDADWSEYTPGYADTDAIRDLQDRLAQLDQRVTDNATRLDEQDRYNEMLEERMNEFDERLNALMVMLEEQESVGLTIDSDVLFAFDSADIRETAKPTLARVAQAMFEHSNRMLTVVGHTDNIGTEAYNQGLSERRAASVKEYLVDAGVPADRIMTQGMGETMPIAPNDTEEGRQLNRRVDFNFE